MRKPLMLFICSEPTKSFYLSLADHLAPRNHHLLTHEQDLDQLKPEAGLAEYSHCFIEVELCWHGKETKDCYGFDVARALRRYGLRCGLYFCTYRNASFFDVQKAKFALLQAPRWHKLVFLPTGLETFRLLPELQMNREQWEDVVDTLTEVRFLVQEVLHDLKNGIIGLPDEDAATHRKRLEKVVDNKFKELLVLMEDRKDNLLTIQDLLMPKLNDEAGPGGRPQEVIEQFTNLIINISPKPDWGDDLHTFPDTKWKVLFLDDELPLQTVMAEGFQRNSIGYVMASSAEQAMELLKEDTRNTITILLCDIRLKNMDTGIWHDLQGYDVIHEARLMPNFLAFAALTSARKRIKRLQQQSTLVSAFYKKDVLETSGGMNIFLQKIRELGDSMFFKSRNRPVSKSWTSRYSKFGAPLSHYYREHLFSSDYEEAESHINNIAKRFAENVLDEKSFLNERIPFTGTFTQPPTDPEALEAFRSRILTGRRIALALWLLRRPKPESLYLLIRPDEKFTLEKFKQLFNTFFCLSLKKDIPDKREIERGNYLGTRLLEEEIRWLVDAYGINFELSAIQQNRIEIESVGDTLQGLQDLLLGKKTEDAAWQKKLDTFQDADFQEMVIVDFDKLEEQVKLADALARHFEVYRRFHEWIRLDLEAGEFQHPKIKTMLEDILK